MLTKLAMVRSGEALEGVSVRKNADCLLQRARYAVKHRTMQVLVVALSHWGRNSQQNELGDEIRPSLAKYDDIMALEKSKECFQQTGM